MAKEKRNETEELRNQLQRALADYANFSRRVEEEKKAVVKFANVVLLSKFLDVFDNLEQAQKNLKDQGLELVLQKMKGVLTSEGVQEIELEGKTFDPNLAEAVDIIPGEEDDKIVEVLGKGYEIDGKVIRPARVRVTKKKEKQDQKEDK